jgi:hypothetical protein
LGNVEALMHGGFHCAAMRLIKRMNLGHGMSSPARVSLLQIGPANPPPIGVVATICCIVVAVTCGICAR